MVHGGGCEDEVEREGDVGGWSMGWLSLWRSVGLKVQLWGVESMGLGFKGTETREFGFEFWNFFFICLFPRKVYREDEKVQKEKKNLMTLKFYVFIY